MRRPFPVDQELRSQLFSTRQVPNPVLIESPSAPIDVGRSGRGEEGRGGEAGATRLPDPATATFAGQRGEGE